MASIETNIKYLDLNMNMTKLKLKITAIVLRIMLNVKKELEINKGLKQNCFCLNADKGNKIDNRHLGQNGLL